MQPVCRGLINCRFFLHLKNQKVLLINNYLYIQKNLLHFCYIFIHILIMEKIHIFQMLYTQVLLNFFNISILQ